MIRVVLADDHGVVRRGTREFLEEAEDIKVVAEAETGLQALEYVAKYRPDIAILDVQMPAPNGLEVARQLRKLYGTTLGILVLTAYEDPPFVRAALAAGADGYVLKSSDVDDLVAAVHDVADGKQIVTASLLNKPQVINNDIVLSGPLTERELEILRLASKGLTNKMIGFSLSISDRTVQAHLASIYHKLEVNGRTEATMRAIALGWIEVEAEP